MLKPQDMLVLVRLLIARKRQEVVTYPQLSQWTGLSASETHASVRRATACGLLTGMLANGVGAFPWSPAPAACQEFLLHGLKYVFPLEIGVVQRGIPTGTSAPGMNEGSQSVLEGDTWVWPHADGTEKGIGIKPLYRTVPQVVRSDEMLHQAMAALDLLRCSSHRPRRLGENWLKENLLRS